MSEYDDKQLALLERIASALEEIVEILGEQPDNSRKNILNG